MKITRICLVAILAITGSVFLINGCAGGSQTKTAEKNIRESFSIFSQSMVSGDLDTAYGYLSDYYKRANALTPEKFKQDYETNKNDLMIFYKNSLIKAVGVDLQENAASVLRTWGGNGEQLVEFIKEDNIWKINRVGRHITR